MDTVRLGLSLRALRLRRGWAQTVLGERAGVSRSVISRIERGDVGGMTVGAIESVAAAPGCRLEARVLWHGEALDRLLDHAHAKLAEAVVALLSGAGWIVAPEVTFQVGGDRGAVDVLAFHPATGTILVVEVKSVVPDMQSMLASLHWKARHATRIASDRGWHGRVVGRLLVLPEDRTARRRLEQLGATFGAVLPARNRAVRGWLGSTPARWPACCSCRTHARCALVIALGTSAPRRLHEASPLRGRRACRERPSGRPRPMRT